MKLFNHNRKKPSQSQELWPPRFMGDWASREKPHLPIPSQFVDSTWDETEKTRVITHMKQGKATHHLRGFDWCRFRCGFTAPITYHSDGYYLWQEDFLHYIEQHDVKPPQDFIDHVLQNKGISLQRIDRIIHFEGNMIPIDYTWWQRQKGSNLANKTSFLTAFDAEDIPFKLVEGHDTPSLFEKSDGHVQVISQGTLSSVMGKRSFVLATENIGQKIQDCCQGITLVPVQIFRKSTNETWDDFVKIMGIASFELHQMHTLDQEGFNIWKYQGDLYVSKSLKAELEKLNIEDWAFEKEL